MIDPASIAPQDAPPPGGDPALAPSGGDGLPPVDIASMPEGLEPRFWDATTKQVVVPELVKSYADLNKFKTESEAQRAAREAFNPDDYKADLPADFIVPDDLKSTVGELKIDPKDPRLPVARQVAKKLGLDQAGFSELLALDAQLTIADHQQKLANQKIELGKLGANGPQRIQAVESYLKAALTPEKYAAVRPFTGSAIALEALEDIISRSSSQIPGTQPPNPPAPAEVPQAQRWYGETTPQQKVS